jgi:hypothetical protein|tara:strand:+ start:11305 stop:11982 length:678 start_codon:yes stop_codon:yes gene_type:complete
MELTEDQKEQNKIASNFGAPIAGQSLTNNPENPAPFEQAPRNTALHQTLEKIWGHIIQPKFYISSMKLLNSQVPVMTLTELYLMNGFQEGEWNPDLMMMLVEPVAYMFIALAERINIDYVVYNEQEEDAEEGEENLFGLKVDEEKFEVLINNLKDLKTPEGALTQQIENNIRTPLREVEIELKEELEEENKQEQQEQPEQPEQEEQPEKTPEPSLLERPSQNEEA